MHIEAFEGEIYRAGLLVQHLPTASLPELKLDNTSSALAALGSEYRPEDLPAHLSWAVWGVAQIEKEYDTDPVLTVVPGDNTMTLDYQAVSSKSFKAQTTNFSELSDLVAWARRHCGINIWLYWGKNAQGYQAIMAFPFRDQVPLPALDLMSSLPYSVLAGDLLEAAGVEWALRELPEDRSESLKDVRPLVMLGGKPHFQTTVTQHLLKQTPGAQPNRHWQLTDYYHWKRLEKQLKRSTRAVWETFLIPHQQVSGDLRQWQEILYRFLPAHSLLSDLLWAYAKTLSRTQLLTPYFSRTVTLRGGAFQAFESLRQSAQALIANQQEPNTMAWSKSRGFQGRWQLFLNDYGFLGSLDLSQPRLHEQQELWLQSLSKPWNMGAPFQAVSIKEKALKLFWKDFQHLYGLRELLYSDTLWALDQVKQRLLVKVNHWVETGRLEHLDDFWELTQEEVLALEPPEKGVFTFAEPHAFETWESPEVLEDIEASDLQGVGLNNGMAQGQIWWPEQSNSKLPEDFSCQRTILCLEHVNVLHLPLLRQVSGVLVSSEHLLSAGSHLLREWNLPAVVQVNNLHHLLPGESVRLNSDTGHIERLQN